MCGIFGYISKGNNASQEELKKTIDQLFLLSESRGKDASGLAVFQGNLIQIFKNATSASSLITTKEYSEILQKIDLSKNEAFGIIGHARMVTNGSMARSENNQPVIKDGLVAIHNGIVVNDVRLWEKYPLLKREYEVDTEVFLSLLRLFLKKYKSLEVAVYEVYKIIEGAVSVAVFFEDLDCILLSTNTGSLYYIQDDDTFIFASEYYFLQKLLEDSGLKTKLQKRDISQLKSGNGLLFDISNGKFHIFSLSKNYRGKHSFSKRKKKIITIESKQIPEGFMKLEDKQKESESKKLLESLYRQTNEAVMSLRRCTKCILPQTMPFIVFDKDGVCNYCKNYKKMDVLGEKKLEELVDKYRRKDGRPDCIVTFSGGRDSSYGLHYMKNILKMNPVAYSYDWGMLTDLGRRNQSKMTAELGVEHILIAADIKQKRENIRKNVEAWLKSPDLGTIPLFMAGDKQYFYYANMLRKQMDIDLVMLCESPLEKTDFKSGFCGIRPTQPKGGKYYALSIQNKLKMMFYYASQYVRNPAYINSSLFDTIQAFFSYYFIPHDYVSLYKYIRWNENTVDSTLKKYDWERDEEIDTTWRIGDGTAAFYNLIYYVLAGFTENDTFRSNQIREGDISRNTALHIAKRDNSPRFYSLLWYCNTIGVDLLNTLKVINKANNRFP